MLNKIKEGDIVGRKSYEKDIVFIVTRIIDRIAILKGVYERIEADSNISDLELIEKSKLKQYIDKANNKINVKINENNREYKIQKRLITGKILHLDGDKRYSEKSYLYYKRRGLNAVVKNIAEYRQPTEVYKLLVVYNPDILVVTGHDGMIKNKTEYNNINNYRNSKYFIQTVKMARKYEEDYLKDIVIFAGACQSYYEALIFAGANFASSPARILIDFLDPLIVAEKIAITDQIKYITIDDIYKELRDGKRGIDGIGANGKLKFYNCNISVTNL